MSQELIRMALQEDVGGGDVTAKYFVPFERMVTAYVVSRTTGVVSGIDLAKDVFLMVDADLFVDKIVNDGTRLENGMQLMKISGRARSILTAERTALNFLQRLSGIASLTSRYVSLIAHTKAKILDTRKTTPGYRLLEKKAVLDGGGKNHRFGLYDRAMVKDNHIAAGADMHSLQLAIQLFKKEHPSLEVQLEADDLSQVAAFLGVKGVDTILLDNMNISELVEAVRMRGDTSHIQLEASGGVNLSSVVSIAETGVDYISVGALTHSAAALDLGLDFITT